VLALGNVELVTFMNGFDEEAIRKFKASGRILHETREDMKRFVREGMLTIDVCEKAESLIRKKGGMPAFPCNVSINEIAAHYTSPPNDESRIPEKSVVKVDIGVHLDGYVTDTAVTLCFDPEYKSLVDTAEQALETALNAIRPGVSTSRLGAIIEKAIKTRGFKPISNLTGHQIGRYAIHAGMSIPNVAHVSVFSRLKLGRVYAIEPFVTLPNAVGKVENADEMTIFRFLKRRSLKNPHANQLLEYIEKNFRTLPFAERWLQSVLAKEHLSKALEELLSAKTVMGYPVFVEASGKTVAQAEHTLLTVKNGCVVLT